MTQDDDGRASMLRMRAEALQADAEAGPIASTEEAGLVHELGVHQIELELQNEELSKAYDDLKAATNRWQAVFDHAPIPYLQLRMPSMHIREMNKVALEVFGDLRNMPLTAMVETSSALFTAILNSTGSGRKKADAVLTARQRSFLAEAFVERVGDSVLLAVLDVDEARRAQELERAHATRMRTILDSTKDGVVVASDHKVLYVNLAFGRIVGRPELELIGGHLPGLLGLAPDAPLRTGEAIEVHVRGRQGARLGLTLEVSQTAIEFDGMNADLYVFRDLTEKLRLEAEMARVSRLATTGLLVAGVAHEINNPLTYVKCNLQMLKDGVDPELAVELADDALDGVERISAIVRDLRTMHTSGGKQEQADLNDVVADALRIVRPKLAGRAVLAADYGMCGSMQLDVGHLSQVVVNLVANAVDAMPEGRDATANRIVVRTWAEAGEACVVVEDNGRGIAEEHLPHLFDAFFTTRRDQGGTGLGLAVSNSYVEQMGGYLEAKAGVKDGTRFIVHLPIVRRPAVDDGEKNKRVASASMRVPGAPLSMLVVDDEPLLRKFMQRVLHEYGSCVTASGGYEAIRLLESGKQFDILFCDVVMPEGSGREVLAWVSENRPELLPQLVMMSGMSGVSHDHLDVQLPKPFDVEDVRAVVRRILAEQAVLAAQA